MNTGKLSQWLALGATMRVSRKTIEIEDLGK